ncbi:uncharacterized protein LOC131191673 [Ahaetulla prasina]|uniref:uncharacterized protein LOC131191673 n=1 Tax=Ahaetulla prasina TaxID=499056 RepID=UPI00264821DF|nr:uncharacterized protein LOC131191673 [Ahaetulla prasina]
MANSANKLEPFDPAEESWEMFMIRFNCFLHFNDNSQLPDDKKRSFFLTNCGSKVFRMAVNLLSPRPVHQVDWSVLQETLKAYYEPTPSKYSQRFDFRMRLQLEGEPIADFIASLRQASSMCEFGAYLDEALLDQFIWGLRDGQLRRMLLARRNLSLTTAIDEATVYEQSHRAALKMQQPGVSRAPPAYREAPVHYESAQAHTSSSNSFEEGEEEEATTVCRTERSPRKKSFEFPCSSCGGNHQRNNCRFRDATCRRCEKKGHLAHVCRATSPIQVSRQRNRGEWRPASQQTSPRRREQNGRQQKGAYANLITIGSAITKPEEKTYTMVTVDGKKIKMEVDTGSPITIVSWPIIQKLLPHIKENHLQAQYLRIRDFQGNKVPVKGTATVNVVYGQYKEKLPITIVQGNLPSLMGWDWIRKLGIGLFGVLEINADCQYRKDDLLREFQDVFTGTLGN